VDALFTGLNLGLVAIAVYAMVRTQRIESRLRDALREAGELQEWVASLERQHLKLRGSFFASRSEKSTTAVVPRHPVFGNAYAVCENYAIAQRDGPTSTAAACECDYCAAVRKGRDAFRAAAVPKAVVGAKVGPAK
jgi:hypothetical protein